MRYPKIQEARVWDKHDWSLSIQGHNKPPKFSPNIGNLWDSVAKNMLYVISPLGIMFRTKRSLENRVSVDKKQRIGVKNLQKISFGCNI